MTSWINKLYETFVETGYYTLMLSGLLNTLIITFFSLIIGLVLGSLIACIRYLSEGDDRMRILSKICSLYVTVIRGIPVVVLLLIFYFIILKSADGLLVASITFGINSSAYMAELIRSGINAVPYGQTEAGRSLGLSRVRTMRKIVLPQAVRYILPAVGNELIALLKETAVAGYVAVIDLTRAGNLVRNNTYDAVNPLLMVALTYLVIVVVLSKLMALIERRGSND